jgi:hypothetical protein
MYGDDDHEARVERARLSRQRAEETLARLSAADDEVRAEPRDDGAGPGRSWHFDPVQRNANWRNETQPATTTDRLSDSAWAMQLEARLRGEFERRLAEEREHVLALLTELIADEPAAAHSGLAKDLAELRSAVADVAKSLNIWREAERRAAQSREPIDLPQLPRRAMN